jgi:hypothetical protein
MTAAALTASNIRLATELIPPLPEMFSKLAEHIYSSEPFDAQAVRRVRQFEEMAEAWSKAAIELETAWAELQGKVARGDSGSQPASPEPNMERLYVDAVDLLKKLDNEIDGLGNQISLYQTGALLAIVERMKKSDRRLGLRLDAARMACIVAITKCGEVFANFREILDDTLDALDIETAQKEQGDEPYTPWAEVVEKYKL